MYKIYINQKPLIFISQDELYNFKSRPNILVAKYHGKTKFLLNYIDMLEKGTDLEAVVLFDLEAKLIYQDLKLITKPVKAAGGIVFNDKSEMLVMLRKGFWDLPKGQLAAEETKEQAAIREVMEETGLKRIELGVKAGKTYHIFTNKSGRNLKITQWYFMKSNQVKLVPEEKENIVEVKWIDPVHFFDDHHIYASIEDMLKKLEVI